MKILFLSYYYSPDLSAGSFRATRLVRALLNQLPVDAKVDVITTLPNRYRSFSISANETEIADRLQIRRLPVTTHKSGFLDQMRAYFRFARQALGYAKRSDYDLVVATSGRLMTAVLSAYIASRKKAPLYLDIRDIFVDTIKHIVPKWSLWLIYGLFGPLEKYAIRRASKVNLISYGFREYFKERYPEKSFSYFSNCVDLQFVNRSASVASDSIARKTVLYAGNIGEGQGLHKIVVEVAKRLQDKITFRIIGDGGRRSALLEAVQRSGLDNIELVSPINREELLSEYAKADVLFVHLNDFDAFEKVLPSKIFEYGATGKPLWAGVSGYAAEFLKTEVRNSSVFTPCNADAAVVAFEKLSPETIVRKEFVEKYSCQKILSSMAIDVMSTIDENQQDTDS